MKKVEIIGKNYYGSYKKTRIACRGIIIIDDKILLSYETLSDTWMLPGGGLEENENLESCCRREIAEECGYLVKLADCILEISEYYEDCRYLSYYYPAEISGECERKLTEREKELQMVPLWLNLKEAIEVFSTHGTYAESDEMKRGLYQREYLALSTIFQEDIAKK